MPIHKIWYPSCREFGRKKLIRLKETEYREIVCYLREHYGINLDKKKVLIECRMTRELEKYGISSYERYLELLRRDPTGKMAEGMVNRLTTNYTYFMREQEHFRLLAEKILPELTARRRYGVLSVWCAGCSTGEECYTIAMILQEYRGRMEQSLNSRIMATDISEEALGKARRGVYSARELSVLPPGWREKYFADRDGGGFRAQDSLKSNIRFLRRNLLEPVQDRFDIIFCRNVMIYFDKESRVKLIRLLENSLNPGGYLFTGHAELLTREETVLENLYPAVYRKRDAIEKEQGN